MSVDSMEDAALVAAAARGDEAAFGALYDRYAGLMLGVAIKIVRHRGEAEDVLHDVFMEAWRRMGDYDPSRASVRTWLLVRLRSRCLDRVRSVAWSRTEGLDDQRETSGRVSPAPETRQAAEHLRGAVGELPAEQQQVLILAYFRGLSSTEIGRELGIPTGTVKSRAAAALRALRARYLPADGGAPRPS